MKKSGLIVDTFARESLTVALARSWQHGTRRQLLLFFSSRRPELRGRCVLKYWPALDRFKAEGSVRHIMVRADNELSVRASVLDRLIDYEPAITREPVASRSKSLRLLKESVKRDLEWLLNTRQVAGGLPPDLKELNNSVAAYGLPDFTNLSIDSPADRKSIKHEIELAIKRFEQRLDNVRVTIEPNEGLDRVLRFRIDASLKINPAPEPITFDTVLELGTGEYVVREE